MDRLPKKKLLVLSAICLATLSITPCFADSAAQSPAFKIPRPTRYYLGLQTGFSHHNTSVTTLLPSTATLTTAADSSIFSDYSFHAGVVLPLKQQWSLHLGASYTSNKAQTMTGAYYQLPPAVDPDPDATYKYKLHLDRLMVDTRLYYHPNNTFSIFGGLSIGQVLMKSSALVFKELTGAIPPIADAQTHGGIAYGITAGLDVSMTAHWHASASLSQQWLGTEKINVREGSTQTNINLGQINPLSINVGLSYLF